ncbi:MAG: outer membrane protein assembly factor BamA [candidate division WOR-3 bacterium]
MSLVLLALLIGQYSFIVKDVKVEGLKWWDTPTIMSAIGLKRGQSLTPLSIRQTLKKAYLTEYFDDLYILAQIDNQRGDLLVRIKENPKLGTINFVGMKALRGGSIKDSLGLKGNTPISSATIYKLKNYILEEYRKKGYYGTEVTVDKKVSDDGKIDLTVNVREGTKARIKQIIFHGNNAFSSSRLKRVIKTKEKKFLIFTGKLDEEKFTEDLRRLKEFYMNNGYPEVKIDSTTTETKEKELFVHIYLNEGAKYYFGNFKLEGNNFFKQELLQKLVRFKSGELYSQKKINKTIEDITSVYGDSGFLFVNVLPYSEEVRDSFIDLKIYIFEGPRIKIRKIDIVGNTKTYDEVIRRELDVLPGEFFSRQKLIKSQRDLYYLNFFENVEVNFSPTDDSNFVDLTFKVTEKYTGNIGLGATYSQLDGLSAYFQIQQPNFRGKGEIANLLIEYGFRKRNFQIGFTKPWLFWRKQQAGFNLYSLSTYYPQYTVSKTGGNLSYGRRVINDYWRIFTQYTLERTKLYDIDSSLLASPTYSYWANRGWQWSSSIFYSLSFDNRDRVFNATTGNIFKYDGTLSGGPLRGDIHFFKQEFELSKLIPEFKNVIGAVSFKTGYIRGLYHPDSIPFYERFFLGDVGPYGLRGYELRSVGPRENGINIGGRIYFILTLEQRYRINDNMYVLAFFDTGNAFKNVNTLRPFIVKKGIGVGIRMEIPLMGVVGFDFAYGIDSKKWIPHIQLGTSF